MRTSLTQKGYEIGDIRIEGGAEMPDFYTTLKQWIEVHAEGDPKKFMAYVQIVYSCNDIHKYGAKKMKDKELRQTTIDCFNNVVALINACTNAVFICVGVPHLSFWGNHYTPSQWKQGNKMTELLQKSRMMFMDPPSTF